MVEGAVSRGKDVLLLVSIDTEEDNWNRSREQVTLENIGELRSLASLFDRLGIRPTYFTAYQVATDPRAADVIREVCDGGRGEIAAHLHPWNTPPLQESFVPRNSMLKNLPPELQLAKVRELTDALEAAFDLRPRAFRAGRYGLGSDTVRALLCCGYRVDSSVSPFLNMETFDDGPNFVGAPIVPYRLAPDRDVREPAPDGALLEIPLSLGFNRRPFSLWDPVRRTLEGPPFRWFHIAGLAHRTGVLKRIDLSPELASVGEMLTVSRRLLDEGVPYLHVSLHSPTLKPGLSPYAATRADVERVYAAFEAYVEGVTPMASIRFATISEAGAVLEQALTC
jgi:hypothetical protein